MAASTAWEFLKAEDIDPAPDRSVTTWADFLRAQADALLACDLIRVCPDRAAPVHPGSHRAGQPPHPDPRHHRTPAADWVSQATLNLAMDLEDAGATVRYLLRDRDAKFPPLFEQILAEAGIQVVFTGVRMPRMNAVMERWVQTCRHELLNRSNSGRSLTWACAEETDSAA